MRKYLLIAVLLTGCAGSNSPLSHPYQGYWSGDAVPVLSPDHTAWHFEASIQGNGTGVAVYQEQNFNISVSEEGAISGDITGTLQSNGNLDVTLRGMHLQGQLTRSAR